MDQLSNHRINVYVCIGTGPGDDIELTNIFRKLRFKLSNQFQNRIVRNGICQKIEIRMSCSKVPSNRYARYYKVMSYKSIRFVTQQ